MTSDIPKVSIIIPTYNRSELLRDTVESFLKLDYPVSDYEIIVADNNSSDDTCSVVERLASNGRIRYIKVSQQGVHYARNAAAKIALGELLYFTDDDMIANPGLLGPLVELFAMNENVACATGKVLPIFQQNPPDWVIRCLNNQLLSLTPKEMEEELTITRRCFVYSCHMAIRKDIFMRSGGFNPENTAGEWLGDGETGLCLKMRAQGWLFGYTAASKIFHVIPPSRMTLGYLVKRMANQGNCDSFTEYRSHRQVWRIPLRMLQRNTVHFLFVVLQTAAKIVSGCESWQFIPARLAYFHRRNWYDLKFIFSKRFRQLAETDDWLSV